MKKTFISGLATVLALGLTAQSYTPAVKLEAGKKYVVVTTTDGSTTMEAMGQTIETPVKATTNAILNVKEATKQGFQSSYVTNRIIFSSNIMGQDMSYDSDKKEDRDGKMGETMNKMIGAEATFTVDVQGNIVKESIVKPKEEATAEEAGQDMIAGIMSQMGVNSSSVCPVFNLFVNNKEIKIGDSFIDSSSTNDKDGTTKSTTTYILKEIKDGKATFTHTGQVELQKKMEMQTMEFNTTSTSKSSGDMIIDIATGLLVNKTILVETNGNVEVAGMTMPTTGKTSMTITVTEK